MRLKNIPPSPNYVDERFQQSVDNLFSSIRDNSDPYVQLGGSPPEGYANWITKQLDSLSPEEWKDIRSGHVTLDDIMYLRALKKYGPAMVDPDVKRKFSK